MKYVMVGVRDAAVGAFSQPFFTRSRAEAIRSFGDAVADPKMPFGSHPGDFQLYEFGVWDDNGKFEIDGPPELISNAIDWTIPSS